MNKKNLLVPKNEINISEEQIQAARNSLLQRTENASKISDLRKNVEERKKQLSVLVDESNLNSTQRLANALTELDDILLDEEVLQAVRDGIISSKDPAKSFLDYTKATTELYNRMMKQQLSSANPEAPQNVAAKKAIKIAVVDSSGATMVSIGGED